MPNDTRKNFGVRLPSRLIAAIEARATTTGRSKTQVVESALGAYLGMGTPTEGQDVEQRLTEIEQRLTEIEQRLTPSTQKRSTAVEQRITRNAQQRLTPPDAPEPTAVSNAEIPAAGEGVYTGDALILAGAPITEAQAKSKNRDRDMMQVTGLKSGPWLEAQGWVLLKARWHPPK